MKVTMLTINAGPEGYHDIGDVIDVPNAYAKRLVDGGYAKYVDKHEPKKVETTAAAPAETADVKAHKPSKFGFRK